MAERYRSHLHDPDLFFYTVLLTAAVLGGTGLRNRADVFTVWVRLEERLDHLRRVLADRSKVQRQPAVRQRPQRSTVLELDSTSELTLLTVCNACLRLPSNSMHHF